MAVQQTDKAAPSAAGATDASCDPARAPNPDPEKSIYVIPPIEGAIYNICLTTLLKSKTDPAWTFGTLVAAPLDQGRGFAGLRPLP